MTENVDRYEIRTVYFTNYPLKHPAAYRRSRGNAEECCRLVVARAKGPP